MQKKPPDSIKGLNSEVWVSLGAVPSFKIDSVFTQFRFYERAELTASGRPLKIDRQMIPPFITRPDNPAANNNQILRQKI